jgi:hypothetical protein
MASSHPLGLDEHHHLAAPPNVTTVSFTHTLSHPADGSRPPSPTAIAAATTLATLADGRPPASYEDYEDEDDDDDYSGGISITSADLHEYMSASSAMDTYMTEQDVAEQQQSIMAEFPSFPTPELPTPQPVPSYQIPSVQAPIPHVFLGHTSSSDPVLEPLAPTLQEAHLSIEDKGSFIPITSFFHRITPPKPTVPGLDLVQVPLSITRDDLQGDKLDPQGIDWYVRNVTRSYVRAIRAECEAAQLSASSHDVQKEVRQVCNGFCILVGP